MDRVGITVLEEAFDAKPMYDNIRRSDQPFAGFEGRGDAGPCAQHGTRYMQAPRFHLRKEMADRPIFG
jgi:hypothetical protein